MIRRITGSADALKLLLLDLKKYSFSGYLRTIRVLAGEPSEGFVFVRGGDPLVSLHYRENAEEGGRAALKQVWQDSYDPGCSIELHARVDVDGFLDTLGRGELEKPRRPSRRGRAGEKPVREDLEAKLARWVDAGYKARDLEVALKRSPEAARSAFEKFEENVMRSEMLRGMLRSLDAQGFEDRVASVEARLRDVANLADAELELETLRQDIERARREEMTRSDTAAREEAAHEEAREILESILRHRRAEGREGASGVTESAVIAAIREESPVRDERTNLIRKFTFDTFVVGPSNRFAQAASLAVAKSAHNSYNPLFITAGPGLGKTHLLNAIGNAVVTNTPQAKVLYLSVEAFANEMREAQAAGTMAQFRNRYRGLDVLFLDDIHFLSGRGDVQEELFHTFNELYEGGKRVVLASDRLPKEIPDLEDRLVSRFESGLVADVRPPEYETRIAILRRRAEEAGARLDGEILPYIAQLVQGNIRELGGALNRVLAFSSLMDQEVTLALAREVLQYLEAGESQDGPRSAESIELQAGASYLVQEDRPSVCFRLYARARGAGDGGLVVTRTNPRRLPARFELGSSSILWLTDRENASSETIPPVLERIAYQVEEFMRKSQRGAILLDGVEYLVSSNSFESVLRFLRSLVDQISESRHTLFLSVGPNTLREQELRVLEREMEVLKL